MQRRLSVLIQNCKVYVGHSLKVLLTFKGVFKCRGLNFGHSLTLDKKKYFIFLVPIFYQLFINASRVYKKIFEEKTKLNFIGLRLIAIAAKKGVSILSRFPRFWLCRNKKGVDSQSVQILLRQKAWKLAKWRVPKKRSILIC